MYGNEDIILEYNTGNQITARYTHGPGIDEPLAVQQYTGTYYYHADGLGSIGAMTDTTGAVVQTYIYDDFGIIKQQTGPITQPYTYTAREYDTETGLYYYRARYYDPVAGRFITRDPIGFEGGINQYAYVGNNPVNWGDPSGEHPLIVAGVGVIAAYVGYNLIKAGLNIADIIRLNKERDMIQDDLDNTIIKCMQGKISECECQAEIDRLKRALSENDKQRYFLGGDALFRMNPNSKGSGIGGALNKIPR